MRTFICTKWMLMLSLMLFIGIGASWATTITVQLRDSDGNTLPDGNTARLTYYSGGWIDIASNDGYGNFEFDVSLLPTNKTIKMGYNGSSEQRELTGLETSPVVFTTVTFTAVVKNANGVIMPGAIFTHRQSTWHNYANAGEYEELLPGDHIIHMNFHTTVNVRSGIQVSSANDPHIEVFTTTTVTPKLLNCNGEEVNVSNNPNWRITHGCVGPCLGCSLNNGMELLPGSQNAFNLWYQGTRIEKIGNYPPGSGTNDPYIVPNFPSEVIFYAPSIIQTFVWHDMNGDGKQDDELNEGIKDVLVELVKPNGMLVASAITDEDGIAAFSGVPENEPHKLIYHAPLGFEFTGKKGGITSTNNSDADKNGKTSAFSVQNCSAFIDYIDAGLEFTGSSNKWAGEDEANHIKLYPNPAYSNINIEHYMTETSKITIRIIDMSGKEIALIQDGVLGSGQHTWRWNLNGSQPGTYICHIIDGDNSEFIKFFILE